jgi:hypothetical protein
MNSLSTLFGMLVLAASISHAAESDTRVVEAEFDRCKGIMERVDRSIQRLQDAVSGLKHSFDAASDKREGLIRDMDVLETRVEYFRSRFDRAVAQADKNRNDLKTVKGGQCSSCISVGVNLYCRNAETMLTDLEEQISQAMQLESRLGHAAPNDASGGDRVKTDNFSLRRGTMDSTMNVKKNVLDSCTSAAGKALWSQCNINLHKADSLHAQGSNASEKALDVTELLLKKALDACGAK